MTVSLLRTRTLSGAGAGPDRRLYTSPHSLRKTGTVTTARNSFHSCKLLSAVRQSSSHCTRPHPCTVTVAHHPHTRPPDIPARIAHQGSLSNTYCTSDLCRPSLRARQGDQYYARSHHALALTRSCAGVDLPGTRHDMSDDDTVSSPAARGGVGARAHRSEARREDRDTSRALHTGDFPVLALFVNCMVT
jgi:hypothetical protein